MPQSNTIRASTLLPALSSFNSSYHRPFHGRRHDARCRSTRPTRKHTQLDMQTRVSSINDFQTVGNMVIDQQSNERNKFMVFFLSNQNRIIHHALFLKWLPRRAMINDWRARRNRLFDENRRAALYLLKNIIAPVVSTRATSCVEFKIGGAIASPVGMRSSSDKNSSSHQSVFCAREERFVYLSSHIHT